MVDNNSQTQDMNTRFTALGKSGAGKSCYILGMYHAMSIGQNGFLLTTENEFAKELGKKLSVLRNNEIGVDRFPPGTPTSDIIDYSFLLSYKFNNIMTFDWVDYGGGVLDQRDDAPVYTQLEDNIGQSTALYIFIDGKELCAKTKEERMRNVQWNCASTINSYIKNFKDAHPGKMPPVIFVVTKMDLCRKYVDSDEIHSIICESFSAVFGKGSTVYITGVSLGMNISDDDYKGEIEPIRIHIPFFLGIFHEFGMRINCNDLNSDILSLLFGYSHNIKRLMKLKNHHLNRQYADLYSAIKEELIHQEQYFTQYIDGQKQDRFITGGNNN